MAMQRRAGSWGKESGSSPCKKMDVRHARRRIPFTSCFSALFIALCRFNSDVCSNCVALSQYVDDAGVHSTPFTISPYHVVTEKLFSASCCLV